MVFKMLKFLVCFFVGHLSGASNFHHNITNQGNATQQLVPLFVCLFVCWFVFHPLLKAMDAAL